MSEIDPSTVGSQTSQTSAIFFLIGPGGTTLTQVKYNVNQKIDFTSRPVVDDTNTVYGYSISLTSDVYYLSGSTAVKGAYFRGIYKKNVVPMSNLIVLATSTGGTYVSPAGVKIAIPAGNSVPQGWALYKEGAYVFLSDAGVISQSIPGDKTDLNGTWPVLDGNYQISALSRSGQAADVFVVTKGVKITGVSSCYLLAVTGAAEPPPAPPVSPSSEDLGIKLDPTGSDPYSDAPADPWANQRGVTPPSTGTNALLLVGKIIAVVGLAGIGYVGYLIVTNPEGAKVFLARFTELKGLIIDSTELIVAFGVIAAIGFVSYEFAVAYNEAGDVPGAIASMTASVLELFVKALVDAVEDLISDAASWAGDQIDKVGDAIKGVF
jgi:hypothetical protein